MYQNITLGIDPGLKNFGYIFLKFEKNHYQILNSGILHLTKEKERGKQLEYLFNKLSEMIDQYQPSHIATENIIYKHLRSSFILNQVYSILLLVASLKNKAIYQYSPLNIKKNLLGKGNASKVNVRNILNMMIPSLEEQLKKNNQVLLDDLYDALAVSIAHIKNQTFTKNIYKVIL